MAWKELGGNEKAKWEEKAKEDKVRYQKEMSKYLPPSDDNSGEVSDDEKPKAKRAKRDPNAPKQPLVRLFHVILLTTAQRKCSPISVIVAAQNAYMLYANSTRAQVRKENPDLSMSELVSFHG